MIPRTLLTPCALLLACATTSPDTTTETTGTISSTAETSSGTTMQMPVCGDGILDAGEMCDAGAGNLNPATAPPEACTTACKVACGDGTLSSLEECEDANTIDTDACSNTCIPSRIVFITSLSFSGNLGGITGPNGADAKCQAAADSVPLQGTYMAWLTDSNSMSAPATRFNSTSFNGWYLGTDGATIAHGWTDLTTLEPSNTDYLKAPIHADEHGADIGVDDTVWTNTGPDGEQTLMNQHCADWSDGSVNNSGTFGASTQSVVSAQWTDFGMSQTCSSKNRLYCFQTSP